MNSNADKLCVHFLNAQQALNVGYLSTCVGDFQRLINEMNADTSLSVSIDPEKSDSSIVRLSIVNMRTFHQTDIDLLYDLEKKGDRFIPRLNVTEPAPARSFALDDPAERAKAIDAVLEYAGLQEGRASADIFSRVAWNSIVSP